MKGLLFLFLCSFYTSSFATILSEKINTDSPYSFNKNNETYHSSTYNLQKNELAYKKDSFTNRIKNNTSKVFINQITSQSNRSLQLLAIKLDSIKKLHVNGLLKKDVLTHPDYYNSFLIQLKKSNIINQEYLFLENELLKTSIVTIRKKHHKKANVIIILVFCLAIALSIFVTYRKKSQEISLTKQELVIKHLIIEGKSNKEIANELHISLNTVKTHISNLYQKLKISNRKGLITGK